MRNAIASLLVLLVACQPPPVDPANTPASASPTTPPPAPIQLPQHVQRTLAVVPTLTMNPSDLATLHFDPRGVWVTEGCDKEHFFVWQLGTGHYLGCFSAHGMDADCPTWADLRDCAQWPVMQKLEHDVQWPALSPDGLRRAKLSADAKTLEILEQHTGRPLEKVAIPLARERGAVLDAFCVWGPERVAMVLTREWADECDEPEQCDHLGPSYEIWTWSASEGLQFDDTINWQSWSYEAGDDRVSGWYLSPDRSWLFAAIQNKSWPGEVAEFVLGGSSSGFDSYDDADESGYGFDGVGEWLSGRSTTWLQTPVDTDEGYHVAWTALQLSPEYATGTGTLIEFANYDPQLEWQHVAFERGALVHAWTMCWSHEDVAREGIASSAYALAPGCVGERPVGACQLLAAGPGGQQLLAQCEHGGWIGPPTPTLAADAQTFAGQIAGFSWTTKGLLVATASELWRYTGASLEPVEGLAGARILDARLAAEVALVLVEHRGELVVLDPATGTRVMELGAIPVSDAAFDPHGRRLAIATREGEVLIFERDATEPSLRWHVDGVVALAWRQDGAALMTGSTPAAPDRLWSTDRTPVSLPIDLSELDPSRGWKLDPSWRWAIDDSGTFLRTLDLVQLERQGQAMITDTGLFDGPLADLDVRLVFLEQPQWGAFDPAELEALARHPNLAAAFFAGAPLPSPPTPERQSSESASGNAR